MLTEEKQHKFNRQIQISRMLVPISQHDFHLRITDNAVSPQLLQNTDNLYSILCTTQYISIHSSNWFLKTQNFSKYCWQYYISYGIIICKQKSFWDVLPHSLVCFEAMSVNYYQTTWHHTPQDSTLHSHHCVDLKSHKKKVWSDIQEY